MQIITTTGKTNNKTVFSAQVSYNGEEFMVYGNLPPAPKSSYILVSGNKVGTPDVPEEVAKAIYTQLKHGSSAKSTYLNPDGTTNVPNLEHNLSQISGATVTLLPSKVYDVILNLSYPNGVTGRITIPLIPSEGVIQIELSNGTKVNLWYDDTPCHIYYPQDFFKLPPYDTKCLKEFATSIQNTLLAIHPYIVAQQKALYPPIEKTFKGFKLNSTVDKNKLNELVKYVTSRSYANFQVYVDSKQYSKNCTYKYQDIEVQATYFHDNNIAIFLEQLDGNNGRQAASTVVFGYGNKISESLAANSVYGKYAMNYMVSAPDITIFFREGVWYDHSEGSRFNLDNITEAQEDLKESMNKAISKVGDYTVQKMHQLLTDEKFLALLDAVQRSAK